LHTPGYASVIREIYPTAPMKFANIGEFPAVFSVPGVGGKLHAAVAYVKTPAPGNEETSLPQLKALFGNDFEPDAFVFCRGVWDMTAFELTPRFLSSTHAAMLVNLRREYPKAMIFTYPTHFMHSVDIGAAGCSSRLRQVQLRRR
jgi:hypothetical protein